MKRILISLYVLLMCLSFAVQASDKKVDYNKAYTGAPQKTSNETVKKSKPNTESKLAKKAAKSQADLQNQDYKEGLCAKVKQCRLGSILAADAPEFMQSILVETINTQCPVIVAGYEAQIIQADLEDQAKSCVSSLENKSCQSLLASDGKAITAECDTFLTSAEQAGIDFSNIQF